MQRFCELFDELDTTTKTKEKISALSSYFKDAPPEDAAWAVFFLSGHSLGRLIPGSLLRQWISEELKLPIWLIEEAYHRVGDSSETLALLSKRLAPGTTAPPPQSLHQIVTETLKPLKEFSRIDQQRRIRELWQQSSTTEVFLISKMLSGGLRVGVAQKTLIKALSETFSVDEATLALRLSGLKEFSTEHFYRLIDPTHDDSARSNTLYPFFLAHSLQGSPEELGPINDWTIEWKWDGVRAQLVKRSETVSIWTRGEEILNTQFPEIVRALEDLPHDLVMDGELIGWKGQSALPFQLLQKRIGHKKVTPALRKSIPVAFIAYDILELDYLDIRERPLSHRRKLLTELDLQMPLLISQALSFESWSEASAAQQNSRKYNAEGLMLKPTESTYGIGRKKGGWLKWKLDPLTLDAVLLYAQRGSGRRAGLYSDFTLGVWRGTELVPIAKAYSGLTDAELEDLSVYIRRNTKDRFGPVRSVAPLHVFEIAFEAISLSSRHKSGYALRFPRIIRWRKDLKPENADSIERLEELRRMSQGLTPDDTSFCP
jgi:DNA ligase-1